MGLSISIHGKWNTPKTQIIGVNLNKSDLKMISMKFILWTGEINRLDFIWLSDTYYSYWPKQKILSTKLAWAANFVYFGFERDIITKSNILYNGYINIILNNYFASIKDDRFFDNFYYCILNVFGIVPSSENELDIK